MAAKFEPTAFEALRQRYGLGDLPEVANEDDRLWHSRHASYGESGHTRQFLGQSQFGTIMFGSFPDGHKGWRWAETGGGGPITLPYSIGNLGDGDDLFIGLIKENRFNLGGDCWCVIGGFKDINETNDAAQAREASEETGLDTKKAKLMDGLPFVSNRNYFFADPKKDEGIHPYAHEIPFSDLEPAEDGWMKPRHPNKEIKGYENVRFIPWSEAILLSSDGIALAGIARLIIHIGMTHHL